METDARLLLRKWQARVFAVAWITYFAYYLCRYNMAVAKTRFCSEFGWSSATFGKVLSALAIFYAVGQFVNGQLGNRFGTRVVSSLGAIGSAVMNLCVFALLMTFPFFSLSQNCVLWLLMAFWAANGFFQAMGWAPMVRAMAYWFPLSTRGRIMGLFGTSYELGAAASVLLATFFTGYYAEQMSGNWRMAFLVPSFLLGMAGIAFFLLVRDEPSEVGMPHPDGAETIKGDSMGKEQKTVFQNALATLSHPHLWIIAGTFLLLNVNRYGFINWLPGYLDERAPKDASAFVANLTKAIKLCIHPLAGAVGAVVAGWATDRFFEGRRAPVAAILLALLGGFSLLFTCLDPNQTILVVVVVALVGFCTYGPDILLVGHAAMDFGKKEGASGAAGFINAMGYVGATLAGWGGGALIDWRGHSFAFTSFAATAFLGAGLVCALWKINPHKKAQAGDREP